MTSDQRRAVLILRDPKIIRLLADLTRSEILRFLSEKPMTEKQLSEELGLTKAAVGYHLRLLREAGLIEIDRVEAEEHGILQKYYVAVAALFIVDPDYIPNDARRYFLEMQIEHLRGMLSVFKLFDRISEVSSEGLERLAEAMLRQLRIVGERHVKEKIGDRDPETLRVKIYAEALANLTKEREWNNLFRKLNGY